MLGVHILVAENFFTELKELIFKIFSVLLYWVFFCHIYNKKGDLLKSQSVTSKESPLVFYQADLTNYNFCHFNN